MADVTDLIPDLGSASPDRRSLDQSSNCSCSSSSTSSHACRKPWKPESSGSRAAAMRTESSI
ncbi:hypothetical protein EYF80_067475 [Liparis tanakae]|uniref:Uncharacterized protein n=1 Tax=Liparis tanakae TaxID=230148 RepID=A0A4Z2E0U4_9TELE|nr:hypothetical protein EYF80_067475 [Liparis tanakae]